MKLQSCSDLGGKIRERRKALHYTQTFVSEFSGLSVSFISDVEHGKPTVEFEKVLLLIHLLGMDLNLEIRGGLK